MDGGTWKLGEDVRGVQVAYRCMGKRGLVGCETQVRQLKMDSRIRRVFNTGICCRLSKRWPASQVDRETNQAITRTQSSDPEHADG